MQIVELKWKIDAEISDGYLYPNTVTVAWFYRLAGDRILQIGISLHHAASWVETRRRVGSGVFYTGRVAKNQAHRLRSALCSGDRLLTSRSRKNDCMLSVESDVVHRR